MYKDEAIERALVWAYRQSYSCGSEALDAYCAQTEQTWSEDYQGIVSFKDTSQKFFNDHFEIVYVTE